MKNFIMLRIFLALGIISIVWTYALPGDLSTAPVHAEQMRSQPEQELVVNDVAETESNSIVQMLNKTASTGSSKAYLFFLAFLAGILISFTPCVYPMIPITIGILHTQASNSFTYNLLSALLYVAGIATVYASLGYFAATASVLFGQWMASPWVLGFMIAFFIYLAFSMFGFYPLYIPGFLNNRDTVQVKGSLIRTFFFGLISGTVASPCLTPGLAALLAIVAQEANPFVGFFTMFCFALGMGLLLILIGTFSGALAMLPRAGSWMTAIERVMGFLMLAMAVYFAHFMLADTIAYALYAGVGLAGLGYGIVQLRKN